MEEGTERLRRDNMFANDHECDICDTDVLFSGVSVDCNKTLACCFVLLFGHRQIVLRICSH